MKTVAISFALAVTLAGCCPAESTQDGGMGGTAGMGGAPIATSTGGRGEGGDGGRGGGSAACNYDGWTCVLTPECVEDAVGQPPKACGTPCQTEGTECDGAGRCCAVD